MTSEQLKKIFPHGRVITKKAQKYLQFEDGTPFFWLADTWWFAMTSRASWPQPFKQVADVRKKQGYTVSQVVIGYPPEVHFDSQNARNSGGSPFLHTGEINAKYFDEVDLKINYLLEAGIVPLIVGGWGHHIDALGVEKIKKLWQEIINRYANYPVVFCLAGEVDLIISPGYGDENKLNVVKKIYHRLTPVFLRKLIKNLLRAKATTSKTNIHSRLKQWAEVATYIKQQAPQILLTAHVGTAKTAGELFDYPAWLDIDSFQSGHLYDRRGVIAEWTQKSKELPIINLEPWYEEIGNQFGAQDQRYAFWVSLLSGAAGYSYGAQGLWNMATTGDQFLSHWGNRTWQEALHYDGAHEISAAVRWLRNIKWWEFRPVIAGISPIWKNNAAFLPFAVNNSEMIIIYVPEVLLIKELQIDWEKIPLLPQAVEWYDPATMQVISTKKIDTHVNVLATKGAEDCLIVIHGRG